MEQLEMQAQVDTEAVSAADREARRRAKAAHEYHREGTVAGCILCEDVAYEPGWYALLASFARQGLDPTITLPDVPVLQI
jgi:hypothetical protein